MLLEITESTGMGDAAHSLGMLARLRLKGFGLSVDDFGTGYSSLAQLSQIPFTELKIDQGFVDRRARPAAQARGDRGQPRPRAQARPARRRRGRGDDGGVAAARALGCDIAQGYLISPPVCRRPAAGGDRALARDRTPEPRRWIGVPRRHA